MNYLRIALMLLALAVCLWVGWSDVAWARSDVSQHGAQEAIRQSIRGFIQIGVQFIAPVLLIGALVDASHRSKFVDQTRPQHRP